MFRKPGLFSRDRINQILDKIWDRQMIFMTAPMGYGKDKLVFRRALVGDRVFIALTDAERVVAMKSWEETNKEMFVPGPYLVLDENGNLLDGVL